MLVGELVERNRRVLVLADPDVISNHGLARDGNAALAVGLIKRLRGPNGTVVFDETIHGYTGSAENPSSLLFRFPFVIATVQGLIAVALLLWATLARFGAPQSVPPPLTAGRAGLLQNMAKLIEFTGHRQVMVRRYVEETLRHVARQLHAPRPLTGGGLVAGHACRAICERGRGGVRKAVVGQEAVIDLMLTSLLVGGHILLEGVPGTAKTMITRSLAAGLHLPFR